MLGSVGPARLGMAGAAAVAVGIWPVGSAGTGPTTPTGVPVEERRVDRNSKQGRDLSRRLREAGLPRQTISQVFAAIGYDDPSTSVVRACATAGGGLDEEGLPYHAGFGRLVASGKYAAARHGILYVADRQIQWISLVYGGEADLARGLKRRDMVELDPEVWPATRPGRHLAGTRLNRVSLESPADRPPKAWKDDEIAVPIAPDQPELNSRVRTVRFAIHDGARDRFLSEVLSILSPPEPAVGQPAAVPSRSGPAPSRPIRSARDAEEAAADHLRWLGFAKVTVTRAGTDEGIDVIGSGIVGQVKAQAIPVGRPVVQQTYGVAAAEGCTAAVFGLAGFTPEALSWANRVGVALFDFDLEGAAAPLNDAARTLTPT